MRFNFSISDSTKHFSIHSVGIVEADRKILLIQRNSKEHHGLWTLPGNDVHTADRLEHSAEDGLQNQTGVKSKVDSLVGIYHQAISSTEEDTQQPPAVVYVYAMKTPSRAIQPNTDVVLNAEWFHYNEIFDMPEQSTELPFLQTIIKDYRRGRRYPAGIVRSV